MNPSLDFSRLEVVREPSGPDAVIRIPIKGEGKLAIRVSGEAELAMKAGVYLPTAPASVAGTEIKSLAVEGTRNYDDTSYEFVNLKIIVRDYMALDPGELVAWATASWSDAVERAAREQADLLALRDALRGAASQRL